MSEWREEKKQAGISEGRNNTVGRTDQEHLRPQKESLDNTYLREERKNF